MAISENNTRLIVIIDKELKGKLQEIADRENRTMSNYVAKLIEDHVKEKY